MNWSLSFAYYSYHQVLLLLLLSHLPWNLTSQSCPSRILRPLVLEELEWPSLQQHLLNILLLLLLSLSTLPHRLYQPPALNQNPILPHSGSTLANLAILITWSLQSSLILALTPQQKIFSPTSSPFLTCCVRRIPSSDGDVMPPTFLPTCYPRTPTTRARRRCPTGSGWRGRRLQLMSLRTLLTKEQEQELPPPTPRNEDARVRRFLFAYFIVYFALGNNSL